MVCASISVAAPPRLNIVFILADDFGYRDLGCYGSTFYQTPNLDRLAAEGMRFTDAYAACPVCSPTRAALLTGKYPARLHLTDFIPGNRVGKLLPARYRHELPLEEFTIAEALKESGYATGFIGKWHLGGQKYFPTFQGFDENIGGCALGHPPSYFSPYKIPTLEDGPAGEYLTDRLTDEAIRFIDEHKEGPFFLYLCHYAVHNPQQAKKEIVQQYRAKAAALPSVVGPEFMPEHDHQTRQEQNQPVYAAMVQSLDESVGRMLDKLAEEGLEDNTLFIFTSDNGGLSTAEGAPTSNAPLRAGKGWLYEGGIREPLIVRWPGVTAAGSTCGEPVISTDFYPTLLAAAGLPPRPQQHVDGVDFTPLLRHREGTSARPPLFWHYPHYANQGGRPSGAIRDGDWKLIESYEDGKVELFNLKDDLSEQHDLADQRLGMAASLRHKLHVWRDSVGALMPSPNPDYVPGTRPYIPGSPTTKPTTKAAKKGGARAEPPGPLQLAEDDDD
jgi:arylsulfatase A-like enzyme